MHKYPDDPTKRFFTYRNRGYLLAAAWTAQAAAAGVAAVRLVLSWSPGATPPACGVVPGCAAWGCREQSGKRLSHVTFTDAAAQSKTFTRAWVT